MNGGIGCVCLWFLSLAVWGQNLPESYGSEGFPASLGNPFLFRPATVFIFPAILGDSSSNSAFSVSMEQFSGLPATRRVELAGTYSINQISGIGIRYNSLGKDHYRTSQAALSYGHALKFSRTGSANWSMGVFFHFQKEKIQSLQAQQQWLTAFSVLRKSKKHSLALVVLKGSDIHVPVRVWIHIQQRWSAQLSTEVSGKLISGKFTQPAFHFQYQFLEKAFAAGRWEWFPSRIYWEQGYRLHSFWLSVHVIRYPLIGWKTGVGLVWNRGVKQQEK